MDNESSSQRNSAGLFGGGIANLTVIGAAFLYFTGTVYQSYYLEVLGVPSGAVTHSIQQTMADGYQAILTAFGAIATLAIMSAGLFLLPKRTRKVAMASVGAVESRPRLKLFIGILYALFFFLAGWGAGVSAAFENYTRLMMRTRHGCSSCFLYSSIRGRVVGIPLEQDDKSIILVTRGGIAILPAGAIKAIRPIETHPLAPWWMSIRLDR